MHGDLEENATPLVSTRLEQARQRLQPDRNISCGESHLWAFEHLHPNRGTGGSNGRLGASSTAETTPKPLAQADCVI